MSLLAVPLIRSLLKEVLEPQGAQILEVALLVAVVTFASGRRMPLGVDTPGPESGDEAVITWYWGL